MNLARQSLVFRALAISLSAMGSAAQQAPTWTAEEAGISALLRMWAAGKELGLERRPALLAGRAGPGLQALTTKGDGEVACGGYALRLHNAGTGAAGEGFVIYAWPTSAKAGARAFAVTGAAEVISTDGSSALYDATREPEWGAAVAHGADPSLAHVLVALGKGLDGQMWLPVMTDKPGHGDPGFVDLTARVRGVEAGKETALQVVVGPACWFAGGFSVPLEDQQIPAGMAPVGADGAVRLTGITAPGLRLGLVANAMLVASVRVERKKDGFEVAFDPEQLAVARCSANEAAAIACLANVRSAQAQCQASAVIAAEAGGQGQYGFFAELAGRVPLRGPVGAADKKMSPPVLSSSFADVRGGRVVRSGYVFQMFLPGTDGTWVAEADAGGGFGVAVDPLQAQRRWRCYAWPLAHGRSGQRAFVVDETGEVLRTDNADGRYDGEKKPIAPDAAYDGKSADAKLAVHEKAGDGGRWTIAH